MPILSKTKRAPTESCDFVTHKKYKFIKERGDKLPYFHGGIFWIQLSPLEKNCRK